MLDQHMEVVAAAKAAFEACGVAPKVQPIRGGTDGARLSFAGLPCPNLSTGGANFHSRYECIPVEDMECMVDVFTHLVNIDRDLLLIPHMAIHMNRLMNTCKGTSALAQLAMHSPYEISPASAERDEGAVQRRDSVHPRRRISGTVTYRSASNHNRFWYVCSFLLASLMEKTALDFLPNTLILFQASTIQNAPPFSPNPPP